MKSLVSIDQSYEALLEALPLAIIAVDRAGNIVLWNPSAERMFGWAETEVLGNPLPIVPENDWEVHKTLNNRTAAGEMLSGLELQRQRKDGSLINVRIWTAPLISLQGKVIATVGTFADNAEQKQMEDKLRESEANFRTLAENSMDYIVRLDRQARQIYANPATATLYGMPVEEIMGKSLRELGYPEAVWKPAEELCAHVFETRREATVTLEHPFQGKMHYFEARHVPEFAQDGSVSSLLVISRDVTDRREAELVVRQNEERFRALLEESTDAVSILDAEGRTLWTTPAAKRMMGYSVEELRVMPVYDFVHPDDLPVVRRLAAEVLATPGECFTAEARCRHRDGTWRWLEARLTNLITNPAVQGVVVNFRDVSARKHAEEAVRASEEYYRKLFDKSPVPMWVYDRETLKFLAVNEAAIRHYDYSRDELLAMTIKEIRPPEEVPRLLEHLARRPPGFDAAGVWRHRRKDGTITDMEIVAHSIDYGGRSAVQVLANDVTERHRMEAALRESEARLRAAFENAPFDFWIRDREGRMVFQNEATTRHWGSQLGKPFAEENVPPAVLEQWANNNLRAYAGEVVQGEAQYSYHGARRCLYEIVAPYRVGNEIAGILGMNLDITDRKLAEEALTVSEQKYRRLHESMTDAFVHVDMEGQIIESNRAYREMLGYSATELYQLTYIDLTPEKWHAGEAKILAEEILPKGFSGVYEKEYRRKDGTVFPVELRAFLLRGADEQPAGIWAIVRDITERKRTEQVLRESEEKYRVLFESAPVGILITDLEGQRYHYANPAICRLLGYSRDEFIQMGVNQIHPPDSLELIEQEFGAQVRGEKTQAVNIPCLRKDGTVVFVEINTGMVTIGGQKLLVGFFTDITERKLAEGALRESEERYRVLFQSAPVGILVADRQGKRFHYANPAVCRLFGYTEEEFLQRGVRDIHPPESLERVTEDFGAQVRGEKALATDLPCIRKDGRVIHADVAATSLRIAERGLVMGFFTDITERKRAEQALRESEEHLRLALEASGAGSWSWDVAHEQVSWDEVNRALYDLPLHGPVSMEIWLERVHPDDRERVMNRMGTLLKSAEQDTWNEEFRTVLPGKGERWMQGLGRMQRDEQGRGVRFTGINLDITDRKIIEEALRAERKRTRIILENTRDVVYQRDLRTDRYDYFSPSVEVVTGFSPAEMIGGGIAQILERIHPDDLEQSQRVVEEMEREGRNSGYAEYRYRHKNGSYRWFADHFSILKDSSGKNELWIGVVRDITDRKRAEEKIQRLNEELEARVARRTAQLEVTNQKLRQEISHRLTIGDRLRVSEQRFRTVINNAPVIIFAGDRDGNCTFSEGRGLQILGMKPGEFVGKNAFAHYGHIPGMTDAYRRAAAGEEVVWTGDVGPATFNVHYAPLRDAKGAVTGVLLVATDDTERVRAERALRESEERFRQMAENINQVFWMEDATEPKLLYVSPAYERIWGQSCASAYAAPEAWADAIHVDDRDHARDLIRRQRLIGGYEIEYRVVRPDGSIRWVRDCGFPVRDADGNIYRVAGVCDDITERKELENALLEISEREQQRIAQDLHDGLCQHLSGIGFMSQVLHQRLKARSHRDAKEAARIVKLLGTAIEDTRSIARGLHPVRDELNGLMSALSEFAMTVQHLFQIRCTFSCPKPVLIDRNIVATHLFRIVQEAVQNAIRHGNAKSIRIMLSKPARSRIKLTVSDDGFGLPHVRKNDNGMGIRIMQYRAAMIGALLRLAPDKRRGTVVTCELSMKDATR